MLNLRNRIYPNDELIKEYLNRFGNAGNFQIRDLDFKMQNRVLDDRKSRFKAVNCTRRSGKSHTEALDHIEILTEYPGSRSLYMGLTLDSTREIIWDVFKDLNKKHKLGLKFNETKSIIFYPNGSRTRLFGLDSSPRQLAKILGQKLRKISVDEAGSITIDLENFIKQKVTPALIDLSPNSWMTLLGTCENIPNTYFEKVTTGKDHDFNWSIHKWTAYENPYLRDQWTAEIADMRRRNPDIDNASWFQTHYLNKWVADDDLLIIPADKMQFINELPKCNDWYYVLGVDLGFNDASSFSVIAASFKLKEAFCVYANKDTEMDLTDVANEIKRLKEKYPLTRIIVDGANKQGIEEMKNRLNLPELEIAEKQGKATFLRLLRDDVAIGGLKFLNGMCDELEKEWAALMWLSKKGVKLEVEDPRCQNHCFVGDTKVKTIFGDKKIKDIKVGDFVLTRIGYREVLKIHENETNELIEISHGYHKTLCTSNHGFFSNNKKIRADNLTYTTRLDTVREWKIKSLNLMDTSTIAIQKQSKDQTEYTIGLIQKKNGYIGKFGRVFSAIYLLVFIFITKTEILKIIALKILNVLAPKITSMNTLRKKESISRENLSSSLSQKPQSGMQARKGLNGTKNTINYLLENLSKIRKTVYVKVVGQFLKVFLLIMQKFVQINAMRSYEGTLVLMTLSSYVSGVRKFLSQTSMQKENVVLYPAMLKRLTQKEKVYNLSVDGLHEYSANGVWVSNCSDATLYAWRHTYGYMGRLDSIIPKTGTEEYHNYIATKMEEDDDNHREEKDEMFDGIETSEVDW